MAAPPEALIEEKTIAEEIGTAVKHSFVYGLGGVLTKAFGFLLLPLYTHYLTPKQYGILEMLDLTMSMLGMFLNMGLSAAFMRYYGTAKSDAARQRILSTSFFFVLGTGLTIYAAGYLMAPRASLLLFGPSVSPIYLLLSFSFFVMGYIGTIPYIYIQAKEQSGRLVKIDTIGSLLLLLVNVFLLVYLKLSILAVLIGPLITGGIKLLVFIGWMAPFLKFTVDWKQLKQMLRFGAPLVFSNLSMFTLNFSDRFFLQRLVSLDAVGIYSVGYRIGFMLNFLLIQQFNMMWQARMYVIDRSPDRQKIFGQVFVLYSLVLIFAALGLSLFSPEVIAIMVDPRYASSQKVVPVVALAYVFLGVGCYLQLGMYLAGKTHWIAVVGLTSALFNLALNYVLIGQIGMMGAAWATLLGFLTLAAGSYYFSERLFPLDLKVGRVLRGLGFAIGIYFLAQQVHLPWLALALVVKIAYLAGFATLVWFTGVLSSDEVATLDSLRTRALGITSSWLRPAWLGRS